MEAIPTICLLLCSDIFECDPQECVTHFTSYSPILAADCEDYRPFNLSALPPVNGTHVLGDDLTGVKLQRCSLLDWTVEDADILSDRGVSELAIIRSRIQTFSPLTALSDQLTSLIVTHCEVTDEIAESIPNTLEKIQLLDLSNNKLATLPESFRDFRGLTKLDISNNQLVTLDLSLYSTFLVSLIASHNALQSVRFSQNQVDLLSVDLSQNQLSDLDWLRSQQFPRDCRHIDISNNLISVVGPENIGFLQFVEYYNISSNNITDILSLTQLTDIANETVDMRDNPLHCDCDLAVIARISAWRSQLLPICHTPALLAGYSLTKLADEICLDSGGKKFTDNKLGTSPAGIVLILGGVCCMFGAVAVVGYITQTRRANIIVLHKQGKSAKTQDKTPLFSVSHDINNVVKVLVKAHFVTTAHYVTTRAFRNKISAHFVTTRIS